MKVASEVKAPVLMLRDLGDSFGAGSVEYNANNKREGESSN